MTRVSILLLAAFSTLAFAQDQGELPVESVTPVDDAPATTPTNLEEFPSILPDPAYPPPPPPSYPTDEPEQPGYGSTAAPVYPTATETAVPYPSEAPEEPPVATDYPPQPPQETTLVPYPPPTETGGNGTLPEQPSEVETAPTVTATFADAGANIKVQLPVVLGALALAFAML